ncbi:Phosphopyruvate hydratase [Planctomycetales bacterium 10988]|nr:Phosphopyruvate hydratase [Planctomycetales bacterium 10988]
MATISTIRAREVLDSRGRPTVEVEVTCEGKGFGRAIVPSGASTGQAEAFELRDDESARYDGYGVLQAVDNVNKTIAPELIGFDCTDQIELDKKLDSLDTTRRKLDLGANAVLGVSLAAAHAAADAMEMPLYRHLHSLVEKVTKLASADQRTLNASAVLNPGAKRFIPQEIVPRMPLPMTNMISGGLHAGRKIDFQDFLIMPIGAKTYRDGLEWIVRVYNRLGEILTEAGYEAALVGDEGGYGPALPSAEKALEYTVQAIEKAKLHPGDDVVFALDVAASHFFKDDQYHVRRNEQKSALSREEMTAYLQELVEKFPILSIEDGMAEEDWKGWREMTQALGRKVWLVGDDLFCTNSERIYRGVQIGAANSVLIKVNQIGTLTAAMNAMATAWLAGYATVVSARSGETEDTTIADLAVASSCGQIKIGSITRSERLAKYNRLLRIAEDLEG